MGRQEHYRDKDDSRPTDNRRLAKSKLSQEQGAFMKIEVEVSEQMEDAIVLESLQWHLGFLTEESIPYSDDPQEGIDIIAAFKLVLGYYGGE